MIAKSKGFYSRVVNTYLRLTTKMNNQINRLWFTCILVFSSIAFVAVVSFFVTQSTASRELTIRVDDYAKVTEDLIADRLGSSEDILRATVGLVDVTDENISRSQFSEFIDKSSINERYPGILTIGYSPRISSEQKNTLEKEEKVEVYPDSEEEILTPVTLISPDEGELASAYGYDPYTDADRREAMEFASENNAATLTKPAVLLVDQDEQEEVFGFAMYVPRYKEGADISTSELRQENTIGYAFLGFRSNSFFSEALSRQKNDNISYQIYSNGELVYEEEDFAKTVSSAHHEKSFPIKLGNVDFTVRYAYLPENVLPNSIRTQPMAVLILGLTGAILVSFLTWLLLSNRNNELLLEKERDINEAKDSLLSIASHQLRTPATGVKQYVGMLMHGMAGDLSAQQRLFLEKAYESNERQLKIINDILYLARLQSGRIIIAKKKIKVRTIIYSLIEEVKERVEESEHKISVSAPKNTVYIWADEHMVRMIIENLLTNAIKYTPNGGKIKVHLKRVKGGISISVKDNGVGIKQEDQEEIFKQFSRIPNSLSKSVSGSGVGLYLVKNLVVMHGGSIDLESDGENGTTFTVFLPTNKPSD